MKQIFALLLMSLLICAESLAGQGGNGGGGITRNGRYMTFYSAGFYTEPVEATSDEIPQLSELINFFITNQYMSEMSKAKYASDIIPNSNRKYFKVKANSFTPEVRARLLAEYGRVMKVNVNEVVLFGITDTESRTTYLFPEYFSLKPNEQLAILFHENYWLVNPRATYGEVVEAEMAFQAHIENPASQERLLKWLKISGTKEDILLGSIQSDLKNRALEGLLQMKNKKEKTNTIKLLDLFGANFFTCKMRGLGSECIDFAITHSYQLILKYPNSLFIKLFYESLSMNTLLFSGGYDMDLLKIEDTRVEYWKDVYNQVLDLDFIYKNWRGHFTIYMYRYQSLLLWINYKE